MSSHRRSPLVFLLWMFALAGCVLPGTLGCSKGSKKSALLTGKVVYNNKPVTGGTLTLHPQGGGASFPISLKSDGTFSVSGAPLGDMKVTVSTAALKDRPPASEIKLPGGAAPPADMPSYVEIPQIYENVSTTPLSWKIDKGNENKTFELKD